MQCLYKRQTLIRRPQSKTAVECLANLSDDNSNDNSDDNHDEDGVKHPNACTAHLAACDVLVHKLQNQFPHCVHVSVYLAAPKTSEKREAEEREE